MTLDRESFQLQNISFHIVTTTGYAFSPAMNKSLHAALIKICTCRGDKFVSASGSPLGPMTRFYPYPFFSDNCFVVLPVGCPLRREDRSVTYSAIVDWSGHWGPITLHYYLIWDCVPSSSPLTARRDYGGGILTYLHMGFHLPKLKLKLITTDSQSASLSWCQAPIWDPWPIFLSPSNFL
jgi:hypothetical protein